MKNLKLVSVFLLFVPGLVRADVEIGVASVSVLSCPLHAIHCFGCADL